MGDSAARVDPDEQAALRHALRVTAHVPAAAEGTDAEAAPRDDDVSGEGEARGAPRRRVHATPPPHPGACWREIDAGACMAHARARAPDR